mmetsp:Transcript_12204/g.22160  ORF Transcript_12204/g.22160 Transcript_12204/m.22160 type:complete len:105 (+) Transcript_12204:139-453(+)
MSIPHKNTPKNNPFCFTVNTTHSIHIPPKQAPTSAIPFLMKNAAVPANVAVIDDTVDNAAADADAAKEEDDFLARTDSFFCRDCKNRLFLVLVSVDLCRCAWML